MDWSQVLRPSNHRGKGWTGLVRPAATSLLVLLKSSRISSTGLCTPAPLAFQCLAHIKLKTVNLLTSFLQFREQQLTPAFSHGKRPCNSTLHNLTCFSTQHPVWPPGILSPRGFIHIPCVCQAIGVDLCVTGLPNITLNPKDLTWNFAPAHFTLLLKRPTPLFFWGKKMITFNATLGETRHYKCTLIWCKFSRLIHVNAHSSNIHVSWFKNLLPGMPSKEIILSYRNLEKDLCM